MLFYTVSQRSKLHTGSIPATCVLIHSRFWQRAVQTSTAETQYRFIQSFAEYTDAVVQQASDRDNTYIRDVGSYLTLRRATIGAKPCFVILEFELGIPPHVLQQPAIEQLTEWAIDLLILGNVRVGPLTVKPHLLTMCIGSVFI